MTAKYTVTNVHCDKQLSNHCLVCNCKIYSYIMIGLYPYIVTTCIQL